MKKKKQTSHFDQIMKGIKEVIDGLKSGKKLRSLKYS